MLQTGFSYYHYFSEWKLEISGKKHCGRHLRKYKLDRVNHCLNNQQTDLELATNFEDIISHLLA